MAGEPHVLVVGAEGVLGAAVAATLAAQGATVVPTSRRGTVGFLPLDLAAATASWQIPDRLTAAVICAALTSTAQCASQPDESRRVNVEATADLVRRLLATGAKVVFPSSNQVFDGTVPYVQAVSPLCPRTAYGRMKAETEQAILAMDGSVTVIRLTKVVHRGMPILAGWKERLGRGEPVQPFSDLPISPLSPDFAAAAIAAAAIDDRSGVVQLSATADVSYAELAYRLASALGCPRDLVRPVPVAQSGSFLEHAPHHTTLDTASLRERLSMGAPDPWHAVDEAIAGW